MRRQLGIWTAQKNPLIIFADSKTNLDGTQLKALEAVEELSGLPG